MTNLLKLRNEDPTVKSLVVSQFTKFLDILEVPLRYKLMSFNAEQQTKYLHWKPLVILFANTSDICREYGFSFTRLDGTMTQKARVKAIQDLQDSSPGSPTIMLLSLKAGGVGLNLTTASRVFLMDPVSKALSCILCQPLGGSIIII